MGKRIRSNQRGIHRVYGFDALDDSPMGPWAMDTDEGVLAFTVDEQNAVIIRGLMRDARYADDPPEIAEVEAMQSAMIMYDPDKGFPLRPCMAE